METTGSLSIWLAADTFGWTVPRSDRRLTTQLPSSIRLPRLGDSGAEENSPREDARGQPDSASAFLGGATNWCRGAIRCGAVCLTSRRVCSLSVSRPRSAPSTPHHPRGQFRRDSVCRHNRPRRPLPDRSRARVDDRPARSQAVNAMREAQTEHAVGVNCTLTEVPHGRTQLRLF